MCNAQNYPNKPVIDNSVPLPPGQQALSPQYNPTNFQKLMDNVVDFGKETLRLAQGLPIAGAGIGIGATAIRGGTTLFEAEKLTSAVARTFYGSRYTSTVLEDAMMVYRYSGNQTPAVGRFLTTADTVSQISSPVAASIALNLPAGNTAQVLNTFLIPAGTRIFTGGGAGGARSATQIFIQDSSVLIPR